MNCSKRAIVFIRSGQQSPPGEFLGFLKITNFGSYLVYCVDGLTREQYPAGWLNVIDETGSEIEKNTAAAAAGTGISLGFNPWGFIESPLPWWLWLLIVTGVYLYFKEES